MAAKMKKAALAKTPSPEEIQKAQGVAAMTLHPTANAAAVIAEYGKPFGDPSIDDLMDSLAISVDALNKGSMKRCEAMLFGQAHVLQAIFTSLSRRAINQDYMKNYETYLRLALKAQGQCRATLETLAAIKNPPVFARQANIANGPQQVNNGMPAAMPHAYAREEKTIQSNELLSNGLQNGPTLDSGRTRTASGADKELATVGKIDGAKNDRR